MLQTIFTYIMVLGFPIVFIWYAFAPLPDERDLPKEKRTRNIAEHYLDTLKK